MSTAVKPTHMPAVHVRRNKMSRRLCERIELARAQQAGNEFAPVKLRSYVDKDTGFRRQVESTKRVKLWWFTADNGKLTMNVRYGARVIELAKGKNSIEIGSNDQLVPTLELILKAVEAGELDAQIEAAAIKLREGFGK
ncbi:DUF6641 family protein [Limnohabitans sp. 2KL-17]|uniref:DUF6641 family protein n=1 Tax=Limnohabitans sp. 2KL-17 TaxID=1100704 RepID=UPI00351A56DE